MPAEAAIDHPNGPINTVVHRMPEEARATLPALPEGRLSGVPFLLKDFNAFYAGVANSGGSRLFRGETCDSDGQPVRRLRTAGVVVVGKTNTPERGSSSPSSSARRTTRGT